MTTNPYDNIPSDVEPSVEEWTEQFVYGVAKKIMKEDYELLARLDDNYTIKPAMRSVTPPSSEMSMSKEEYGIKNIDYKYSEDRIIQELQDYVDGTYSEHYATGKYQATEFIIDGGHGMGFALGNVLKYTQRYGHKDGYNRKDLLKVLHYALIALHVHDEEHNKCGTPECCGKCE